MNPKLNHFATDNLTKFTGTAIGYCEYSSGTSQYLIQPNCEEQKTNTLPEAQWIDSKRILWGELNTEAELLGATTPKPPA